MLDRSPTISFKGAAGAIDCALDWPTDTPKGWALVLHPHPLHGGARENKIVTTVARACVEAGLVALRPNFRGVGASDGEFDAAVGETADMLLLVEQFRASYPDIVAGKWVLGGFSFGTSVAAQLYSTLAEQSQTLPNALLLIGSAVERFRFRQVAVPDDTFMLHGQADEVVPLDEAMAFARLHGLPITVIPDATHFLHGKLIMLKQLLQQRLATL